MDGVIFVGVSFVVTIWGGVDICILGLDLGVNLLTCNSYLNGLLLLFFLPVEVYLFFVWRSFYLLVRS